MMKYKNLICLLILGLTVAFGATGCKKRDVGLTPIPGGGTAVRDPGTGILEPETTEFSGTGGFGGGEVLPTDLEEANSYSTMDPDDFGEGNVTEDRTAFASSTVYFGFDKASIEMDQQDKIRMVADHLAANPLHRVKIEGHCDERGTEQYNLSLGERRAASVREYLINLGVASDRVVTLSYGEELPACTDKSQACYALCRRGEFVLLKPRQ